MSNLLQLNPNAKSLRLCGRCNRTPMRTSKCAGCLRTLLDEVIDQRDRHRQPDLIHTRFGIKFDWKERLRLLFLGHAHVQVEIATQFSPGRVESTVSASVPSLIQRKATALPAETLNNAQAKADEAVSSMLERTRGTP